MENSIKLAEELYGRTGVSKMTTEIIKTEGGNYVYRHIIAGNSRCDARVFNPNTGEDRFLENRKTFHHLQSNLKVPYRIVNKALVGAQVEKHYNLK